MEDLTVEELKQLVVFYKQRTSDLELQLLQLQLKMSKAAPQADSVPATKVTKNKSDM